MIGITFDTWGFFDSVPDTDFFKDAAFQIDAEIYNHPDFRKKIKKIDFTALAIRNPVNARLNRLILESPFKLQSDYLESLAQQFKSYYTSGVGKVMFDFDLASSLANDALYLKLIPLLGAIKGIAMENQIEIELLFRLPGAAMEELVNSAANLRQQTMLGIDFAVDIHIHEAGFDRDSIKKLLLPLEFDISTVNFVYDAALGNKINTQSLQNIIDHMSQKGIECDYFLCPSGNINFQSAASDLIRWMNVFQTDNG